MAKIGGGSIQQKKGWWYFVSMGADKKQKWRALGTQDRETADTRARERFSVEALASDRERYLAALIAQGEKALAELDAIRSGRSADAVSWDGLFDAWTRAADGLTGHVATLDNYRYVVAKLARWAEKAGIGAPAALDAAMAQTWVTEHAPGRSAVRRDLALFARVWRDLGMSAGVWAGCKVRSRKTAVRYRRLSVDEVRRIVAELRAGRPRTRAGGKDWEAGYVKPLPDVADLVIVGYHTGLRRRDCARLGTEHVEAGGGFLRIVPAKTADRKGAALLIPLQEEARQAVARLVAAADPDDGRLFPRLSEASLGKCLRMAFERARVADNEQGHASFHSLRATLISAMDEAGIPPHVTDAVTGHAKAGMHGRYSQPGREALMAAVVKAVRPLGAG